ncbi:39S ribosomal protein L53, mitochondrial isoform X2 [Meleagris gallopavo]|uniref:39S ribosomal protein L53, mitochondrial isoform X2 n=1 Tax=Meleagris gallopavo TaxID=9103 RepID=UPI00093C7296|nr:39S ribosomal protein L53, mitochondrial isoform X2 [Meleagris gallopavo]
MASRIRVVLRPVKSIVVRFCPFESNVESTRGPQCLHVNFCVWNQELDSVILMVPFWLEVFCISISICLYQQSLEMYLLELLSPQLRSCSSSSKW